MLDVVIRGGTVVDGTGSPGRQADVGIRGDRIVAVGEIEEAAEHEIDATGKVVCPGFVDVHTHYDAQAFWDGTLSPSPYHGVTTVFAGNCGFSIAPLSSEAGPYLMRMLARVEGMPLESLEAGVPWDWESFGDYLGKLEGKVAVNAGFMVGHSAIRRVVMGERAVGSEATEQELEAMKALLARSLAEGGMGFSTTISPTHNDGDGEPVPSRHATREELVELARVCRDHEGTTVEFLPGVGPHSDEGRDLMVDVSLAANRPVNWNVMAVTAGNKELIDQQLATTDYARERGAEILALTVPQSMTVRINLYSGFVFDALADWDQFFRLPVDERIEKLGDPEYRAWLDERAHSPESGVMAGLARWEAMRVDQVVCEENRSYEGRIVGEIAQEQGKPPFEMFCEIAIADGLKTSFMPPSAGDDQESWELRGEAWRDDRTVIGASDAGAHLDMIDTFAQTTQVLGNGVRKYGVIELEEAIRQLTRVPAMLYGLKERGELQEGWFADVVVFDPNTVATGPTYLRQDLPAGAGRLYADALGVESVIVNGVEIVRDGDHTGAYPGTVLHSGRDTDTVEVSGS
jgi:N-acyl-D-aspartate/D-glutamate deacylase